MQIKVGDRVQVRQWGGGHVVGIVRDVLDDVKNGRPGIDFEVPDATDQFDRYKWAYMDQVVKL
jgi:hypothetical protein